MAEPRGVARSGEAMLLLLTSSRFVAFGIKLTSSECAGPEREGRPHCGLEVKAEGCHGNHTLLLLLCSPALKREVSGVVTG
eukprot:1276073-Rhodomonas_salina.1